MSIVVFGASGNIGNNICKEALSRGHRVTAVTHSTDLEPAERLTALKADIADPDGVAKIAAGHDAVISAYSPGLRRHSAENAAVLIEKAHASLFEGVKRAGVGEDDLRVLKQAYRLLYRSKLPRADALAEIEALSNPYARRVADFVRESERGVCHGRAR